MDQKTPPEEPKKEPPAASSEKPAASPPAPGAEASGPRKILDQLDNNPAQPLPTDKPAAAETPPAKTESPAADKEKSAPDAPVPSENASGLISEAMQRLDALIQEYKKTDH